MHLSEIFGFVTGVLCVWLGVKEIPWAWPIGIVNNAIFLVLFWHNGLYAVALLQIVYAIISAYGWWNWLHGGTGHATLRVAKSSFRFLAVAAVVTTAVWALLLLVLSHHTDSTVAGWDALTTALSITAQFMLSKKLIENWIIWLVVDVIYIGLAISKGLYVTSALYVVFIILCAGGLVQWLKTLRAETVTAVEQ